VQRCSAGCTAGVETRCSWLLSMNFSLIVGHSDPLGDLLPG